MKNDMPGKESLSEELLAGSAGGIAEPENAPEETAPEFLCPACGGIVERMPLPGAGCPALCPHCGAVLPEAAVSAEGIPGDGLHPFGRHNA